MLQSVPDKSMRETLVFLPGMMCDERLFAPQIEVLSKRIEIIVPKLEQDTIEAMARHVLEQAPDGLLNVVGLSMGGIVAMHMVAIEPERIVRLALLDTNHLKDASERFAIRNRQIADVENGKLRDVIVEEMKPVYLAEVNRSDNKLLALLVTMAMEIGEDTFIAQSLALRDRPDQSDILQTYLGNSLVLCGAEDRLCSPERHREIAGLLANCQLIIVPNAGHLTTLEQPEAVTAALQNWLSSPLSIKTPTNQKE